MRSNLSPIIGTLLLLMLAGAAYASVGAKITLERSIFLRNELNNYWSYYASKSIKSKIYEVNRNHLRIFLPQAVEGGFEPILESTVKNLQHEIDRYTRERQDIQAKAIESQTAMKASRRRYRAFVLASALSKLSLGLMLGHLFLRIWPRIMLLAASSAFLLAATISIYASSCSACSMVP